ncbi:ATP-binding protein [Pelomonas sp. SE-A7]|uniref:sensor histidine kinase n=1 Tax=Pelomonas sp. SE-A7 TaxID=3054953 RepID=UPI00259D0925|nr:ATP-binding protein [Pelomonas sp. SE-A7]MDM4764911.1 ATP-binding protein [Pelomonas sp. SE-A7]
MRAERALQHRAMKRRFKRRMELNRKRSLMWRLRARQRWHERWHRHHAQFKHSVGARLIAVFVSLAVLGGLILYGAQEGQVGAWTAGALLLLVIGLAFGAIRRMLRPLRALAAGVEAFGRGELDHRIRYFHRDELGDLAHRFNQMAADIQAMLDGKRALLLAMSHELRSPLTRARLHAELIEDGDSKQGLLKELAEMRDLIQALLESERLGGGHSALQLRDCDLAALVRDSVGEEVALRIEPGLPLLRLDPMRIQLLLRNLVGNALRHNDAAQGPVLVSLSRAGQGVRLAVRDHGPGVPPEALSQLGEPFYRPDAARSRNEGGVGLGLSLCKLVAVAHGSRLELRNADPGFEAALTLG